MKKEKKFLFWRSDINNALKEFANMDLVDLLNASGSKVDYYEDEDQRRDRFSHTRNDVIGMAVLQRLYEKHYKLRDFLEPGHTFFQNYRVSTVETTQIRKPAKIMEFSLDANMDALKAIPQPLKYLAQEILLVIQRFIIEPKTLQMLYDDHVVIKYFEFIKNEVLRIFRLARTNDFALVKPELTKLMGFVKEVQDLSVLVIPGQNAMRSGSKAKSEISFAEKDGEFVVVESKSDAPGARQIETCFVDNLKDTLTIVEGALTKTGITEFVNGFSEEIDNISLLRSQSLFPLMGQLENAKSLPPSYEHVYGLEPSSADGTLILSRGAGQLVKSKFYKVMPPLEAVESYSGFRDHFTKPETTEALQDYFKENIKDVEPDKLNKLSVLLCRFIASHLRFSDVHATNDNLKKFIQLMGAVKAYAYALPFMAVFFNRNQRFVAALITQSNEIIAVIKKCQDDTSDSNNSTSVFLGKLKKLVETHLAYYEKLLDYLTKINVHLETINKKDVDKMLKEADQTFRALVHDIPRQSLEDFEFLAEIGSPVGQDLKDRAQLLSTVQIAPNLLANEHRRSATAVYSIDKPQDENAGAVLRIESARHDDDDNDVNQNSQDENLNDDSDADVDDKVSNRNPDLALQNAALKKENSRLQSELDTATAKIQSFKNAISKDKKLSNTVYTLDGQLELIANLQAQVAHLQELVAQKDAEFSSLYRHNAETKQHVKKAETVMSASQTAAEGYRKQSKQLQTRNAELEKLHKATLTETSQNTAKAKAVIESFPDFLKKYFEDIAKQKTISRIQFEKIQFVETAMSNIVNILQQMESYTAIYLSEFAKPKFGFDSHAKGRTDIQGLLKEWISPENQKRFADKFMSLVKDILSDEEKDVSAMHEPYKKTLNEVLRVLGSHIALSDETKQIYLSHYFNEVKEEIRFQNRVISPVSFSGSVSKENLSRVKKEDVKANIAAAKQHAKSDPLAVAELEEWELDENTQELVIKSKSSSSSSSMTSSAPTTAAAATTNPSAAPSSSQATFFRTSSPAESSSSSSATSSAQGSTVYINPEFPGWDVSDKPKETTEENKEKLPPPPRPKQRNDDDDND